MTDTVSVVKVQKRILWIDYAKFIGIFLVVCAHQTTKMYYFNFISAFDIPLFFFLSGYLFSFKKFSSYSTFLKSRIRQLIVPYFLMNLVTYVLWFFFFRNLDPFFYTDSPSYIPFIGIFYGNGVDDWLVHCVASWFIVCLFVLENIFFLSFRNLRGSSRYFLLAGFLIICWADRNYDHVRWPWGLNITFTGIIFYGFGNFFKEWTNKLINLSLVKLSVISISSLFILIYFSSGNHVDMAVNYYDNFKLFFIGSFSGILFALTLSRILELLAGQVWIFKYIAQNTLIILAFHLMIMSLVKNFILNVFDIPLVIQEDNTFISLLIVLATLLLIIPVIHLCNTYFPYMAGKTPVKARTNYT